MYFIKILNKKNLKCKLDYMISFFPPLYLIYFSVSSHVFFSLLLFHYYQPHCNNSFLDLKSLHNYMNISNCLKKFSQNPIQLQNPIQVAVVNTIKNHKNHVILSQWLFLKANSQKKLRARHSILLIILKKEN